jgi:hypothetical protein
MTENQLTFRISSEGIFENVSDKFKNVDYDKYGNQIKTGAGKIGNTFGDFIMTIFKIFAKFLGIILIIALSHLNDIIYRHVYGSSSFIDFPWQGFIDAGNFTDYIWIFGLLMFCRWYSFLSYWVSNYWHKYEIHRQYC